MSRGAQKRNKNHEDFAYKPGAQYVLRSIVPKTQDENSEGIARDRNGYSSTNTSK
jgi:hypothetical protein